MDIKEYKADSHQGAHHHPWEYARLEVVYSKIKSLTDKENPLIIDVGCGDAFFLHQLSKKMENSTLYGVDIELTDAMIDQFSSGSTSIQLFKNLTDVPPAEADIILLLDVIEHIEKDKSFLNELLASGYIGPNTKIIITVPAFKNLFVVRDKWLGHFRRYNLGMLKNLANDLNLKTVDLKYFFFTLFLARSVQKIIEKYITKPDIDKISGIGNYKKKVLFDFLFKNTLILDYHIGGFIAKAGLKLPGLSCMAVFSKQE
ncbi:MAG: hypothetical protein GVY19_08735 [Bacteroidetes bacterium]|jgi:2-polyprenyl-3-methyl-5-hydroxy-6-metoxy-1,4-benzoquinol methylase|nr:hypothetical protein [Bacteroidota bacterium]